MSLAERLAKRMVLCAERKERERLEKTHYETFKKLHTDYLTQALYAAADEGLCVREVTIADNLPRKGDGQIDAETLSQHIRTWAKENGVEVHLYGTMTKDFKERTMLAKFMWSPPTKEEIEAAERRAAAPATTAATTAVTNAPSTSTLPATF
jgi:hypothetical protein